MQFLEIVLFLFYFTCADNLSDDDSALSLPVLKFFHGLVAKTIRLKTSEVHLARPNEWNKRILNQ